MQIKDVMTKNVEVVRPDASLKDAAMKMDELNVGAIPVCDGDRLIGMITDRDIVIRSVSAGQDPNVTVVRDAMTSPIIYCLEDHDVTQAAHVMEKNQIRRLPVINRDKRLVGMLSLGDVAVHAQDQKVTADLARKVSEPSKPESDLAA